MNEDRAARYQRLRRRAGLAALAWHAALLIGLLATGASVSVRDFAAAVAAAVSPAAGPPLTVAVYVAVVFLLLEAVALPVAFYRDFLLERRYGLSVEPGPAWFREHVKARAVALVLAVGVASLVYMTLRRWPEWWWAVSAGGFSIGLVTLAFVAPVVVLPLFYRLGPLGRPDLEARLHGLAARAGVPSARFFQVALGARTRKGSAALAGLGRSRRVLLSDRLLEEYADDEIETIVAHELGHHVHHDIWRGLAVETLVVLAAFRAAHLVLGAQGPRAGLLHPADVAGLPLLLLAGGGVSLALSPVTCAISRALERRADRFALALAKNPRAFAAAIRRLAAHNLAEMTPPWLALVLFHTHPPVEERIRLAERAARVQGQ